MPQSNSRDRLPLEHPDYRYPGSRNPYWSKIHTLEGRIYADNQTEEFRGEWRTRFPDARKSPSLAAPTRLLHVEIGCNAGHVVTEWAARNPADAWVGLDWKFKPIFRGAEKGIKKNADNLLFFRSHAERLKYMFAPGEIDRLYLFFPDPWAKKSQLKNRFLKADRLRELAELLHPQGIFHIKTDHPGYFEWMEDAVRETADLWEVVERSTDLHASNPEATKLKIPEVTLFESLFIKDGIRINSLKLRRRGY